MEHIEFQNTKLCAKSKDWMYSLSHVTVVVLSSILPFLQFKTGCFFSHTSLEMTSLEGPISQEVH